MMMRHSFTPLLLLLLAVATVVAVLAPQAARAEEAKNWSAAGSWENAKSPGATRFNAYTEFVGKKDQFTNADLDTWLGVFILSGEVQIPGTPLSVFADVGYQVFATDNEPTGWKDPNVGAKFNLEIGPILAGVYVVGNIPIGTNSVTLDAFTATSLGITGTLILGPAFGNAGMDFGAVWEIADGNGGNTSAFQWHFYGEGGFNIGIASGRLGLEGVLRTDGFDLSQFQAYIEGRVFIFFLRVAVPFDIQQGDPIESVKTAFETGNLKITFGVALFG
ncbi:MAG: hypothetical protein AB7K09_22005 [Planctomycetota bacterium]